MTFPGLEPADDVSGSMEAKLDQIARRENRGVPMVANEDQPLIDTTEVDIAPRAIHGNPPLEYRPRDMHAPGNDALTLACIRRPDVE